MLEILYNLGFMSHSNPNPAKRYPKRTVQRHFNTLTGQIVVDEPDIIDRFQQTIDSAYKAMDDRPFEGVPEREIEPDGVLKRNRAELAAVGLGLVAVSALAGFILGASSAPAPAVRPPGVEVSVSPLVPSPAPGPPVPAVTPGR